MNFRLTFLGIGTLTYFIACQTPASQPEQTAVPEAHMATVAVPAPDSPDLKTLARRILQSLQNKDYAGLQAQVHPQKGLLFSPYGFVDTNSAVRIPAAEIEHFLAHDTTQKRLWGFQDGSGDSLLLTAPAYLRRYGYDRDFAGSDSVLVNDMRQRGNSLNNLEAVFPEAEVVEVFDAGSGELDWRILRLVFQSFEGRPYLVALVHDEWTI